MNFLVLGKYIPFHILTYTVNIYFLCVYKHGLFSWSLISELIMKNCLVNLSIHVKLSFSSWIFELFKDKN